MPTDLNSNAFPTAEELQNDTELTGSGSGTASPTTGATAMPSVPGISNPGTAPTTGAAASADEPMYEVVVGGKKWKVPVSELTKGYQRQRDYTQKTMEIAEARRMWDQEKTEFTKQVEELQKWLENPQNVYAYYQQLAQRTGFNPAAPNNQQPPVDLRQIEQTIDQRVAQARQEFQVAQLTTQFTAEIDKTVSMALETHPGLKKIRGIGQLLRTEVAARQPENLQEAKQLLLQIASEQAAELKSLQAEQAAAAASQSSPLTNGIEPPGGTTPVAVPSNQPMKIGSPEFMKAVLSDLAANSVR